MEDLLKKVVEVLKKNGVVAVPTETVYGLIARASSEEAVDKIFAIKKREKVRVLPCFVKDIETAKKLFRDLPEYAENLMKKYWPGPLTLVAFASEHAPRTCVSEEGKIGIRIPKTEFLLELLKTIDEPLASTSANISGEPPLKTGKDVSEILGKELDFIVDGEAGNIPSTVVDVSTERPFILRKGLLNYLEIEEVAGRKVKFSKREKFTLIFLCTGNTCRSPIAEALFSEMMKGYENLQIISRGTLQVNERKINPNAQLVLKEMGIENYSHIPKAITEFEMEIADLIIAMARDHISWLPEKYRFKARLIDPEGGDLEDPIGSPVSTYRFVRDKILHYLENYWKNYFEERLEK